MARLESRAAQRGRDPGREGSRQLGTAWRLGWPGERQFALLHGCGCELQGSEDVIPFQVRVIDEDLLDAPPGRQLAQDSAYRHPGVPDTGQATHPVRVDGNPLIGYPFRVRQRKSLGSIAGRG